ncbi:uncharacterized protein LOC127258758 isoform X3 [Andrographis paniculata]|uniref:uncharacterized protein LOC127258758 isoform X3 n=1 Tax=Andrographis paniculata TaxID=175694 RepID=UPI0021E8DD38|nr:uncharacterized protein LOC127258758 isoform X3 [Andrographis paniculata]XP_051141691.1 uncharacterized protein LOC127258758 isoform X3 [Andrographis paniculata]
MENPYPLILDISSDEESGFGRGGKGVGCDIGREELTEDEDCYWLARLLGEVDGNKDDESDEVVVLNEVLPKLSKKARIESAIPSRIVGDGSNDDDDDDCVVLDADPDLDLDPANGKVGNDENGGNDEGDDSDDVEIVGEKGEVACRDFPHARHLCAKFPFASTPHEVHCIQCHCYVCDSLAPCSHWGTGVSTFNHCHANDKEDYWISERKRIKQGGSVPPSAKVTPTTQTSGENSLLEAMYEIPQVPDVPEYNTSMPNPCWSPIRIRPCSSSAGAATAVNRARLNPSGHAPLPQSNMVSLQSHCMRNNSGSQSVQSFTPHAPLKRPGSSSFPNHRHVSGLRYHRNPYTRRYHPIQTPMANVRHGSNPVGIRRQAAAAPILPPILSSLPGPAIGNANYLPSPPQMHSRPYSSYPARDTVHFCPQITPQSKLPSQLSVANLENLVFRQSHDMFEPSTLVPSPKTTPAFNRFDGITDIGKQLHSISMISSSSTVAGNSFENQLSQPETLPSVVMDERNYTRQGNLNPTRNDLASPTTDFGNKSLSSFSFGNQDIDAEVSQFRAVASGDISQQQYLTENDDRRGTAAEGSCPQVAAPADNSSQVNGTFSIDNWMFENDSFPGAFEVPLSPWNEYYPDPASVGVGAGALRAI